MCGVEGEIEAGDFEPALAQQPEEEAAAAADVEDESLLLAFTDGSLDEANVVAEDDSAVGFFQARGGGALGREPVLLRIVFAQLLGRGARRQAEQSAMEAFDDEESFRSGVVEPVGGGKDGARAGALARRAGVGLEGRVYAASSDAVARAFSLCCSL